VNKVFQVFANALIEPKVGKYKNIKHKNNQNATLPFRTASLPLPLSRAALKRTKQCKLAII